MNILFLGDIIGKPGRDVVHAQLPALKQSLRARTMFIVGSGVTRRMGPTA